MRDQELTDLSASADLPAWSVLEGTSGALTGTPDAAGSLDFTVVVTHAEQGEKQ